MDGYEREGGQMRENKGDRAVREHEKKSERIILFLSLFLNSKYVYTMSIICENAIQHSTLSS